VLSKNQVLTEKKIIERLLEIRNCALLRMQTCNKFARNLTKEKELLETTEQVG